MGLVVGWPTTTLGGVVGPELELAGIRHGVHEASRDDMSPTLGAVVREGLRDTKFADVGQPKPVKLGDRIELALMCPTNPWQLARP